MFLPIQKYGLLLPIFRAFARIRRTSFLTPAPLPLKRDVGPSYFYSKGGEKILCKPASSYPKARQMSLSHPILGCKNISYRNIILEKALQSYPNFASNLNFFFNRGSPSLVPTPIFTPCKSPSSPIFPIFCYPVGIKKLKGGWQNVRLAVSFAVGTCGGSFVFGTDSSEPKAEPQVRRRGTYAERLSESRTGLYSSSHPAQSLRKRWL